MKPVSHGGLSPGPHNREPVRQHGKGPNYVTRPPLSYGLDVITRLKYMLLKWSLVKTLFLWRTYFCNSSLGFILNDLFIGCSLFRLLLT